MRILPVFFGAAVVLIAALSFVAYISPSFLRIEQISPGIAGDQKYELSRVVSDLSDDGKGDVSLSELRVAAELNNDPEAQYKLGEINENGLSGVKKNLHEAVKWYGKAVLSEHPGAKYRLGLIQQPAGGVLAEDAYRMFRSSSFQGYPPAMFEQAKASHKGVGTKVNAYRAAYWYRKAMELGVMEAHLGLGELYLAGNGLGRNAQAGMRHLALASAAGIPEAQYKLGMAYYLGLGGEVDPIQANRWLREALKNGYKDAIAPLSMIKIA